jgi:hypothetical protein
MTTSSRTNAKDLSMVEGSHKICVTSRAIVRSLAERARDDTVCLAAVRYNKTARTDLNARRVNFETPAIS